MYDWSWKIEHILTDMIDEVEKKCNDEAHVYIEDFYGEEFDTNLNYDDGEEFRAEILDRIYIEYKGEYIIIDKVSDMYELDGLIPVTHIEVLSGALVIVSKHLDKIEKVLIEKGYYKHG